MAEQVAKVSPQGVMDWIAEPVSPHEVTQRKELVETAVGVRIVEIKDDLDTKINDTVSRLKNLQIEKRLVDSLGDQRITRRGYRNYLMENYANDRADIAPFTLITGTVVYGSRGRDPSFLNFRRQLNNLTGGGFTSKMVGMFALDLLKPEHFPDDLIQVHQNKGISFLGASVLDYERLKEHPGCKGQISIIKNLVRLATQTEIKR